MSVTITPSGHTEIELGEPVLDFVDSGGNKEWIEEIRKQGTYERRRNPAWLAVRLQAARMVKSFRVCTTARMVDELSVTARNSAGYADTAVRASVRQRC
jgi:hypothetical protein